MHHKGGSYSAAASTASFSQKAWLLQWSIYYVYQKLTLLTSLKCHGYEPVIP